MNGILEVDGTNRRGPILRALHGMPAQAGSTPCKLVHGQGEDAACSAALRQAHADHAPLKGKNTGIATSATAMKTSATGVPARR